MGRSEPCCPTLRLINSNSCRHIVVSHQARIAVVAPEKMKITVMAVDEQIVTLDVDRDESVENLKALLEVETRLQQQHLLYNEREMRNSDKLSAADVSDGDLIMMVSNTVSSRPRDGAPGNAAVGFNPDGSAVGQARP